MNNDSSQPGWEQTSLRLEFCILSLCSRSCWCCCFYSYHHPSTIFFILILFLHSCTDTYSPDLLLSKQWNTKEWRRLIFFPLKDQKWTDIVQCFEKTHGFSLLSKQIAQSPQPVIPPLKKCNIKPRYLVKLFS